MGSFWEPFPGAPVFFWGGPDQRFGPRTAPTAPTAPEPCPPRIGNVFLQAHAGAGRFLPQLLGGHVQTGVQHDQASAEKPATKSRDSGNIHILESMAYIETGQRMVTIIVLLLNLGVK